MDISGEAGKVGIMSQNPSSRGFYSPLELE